MAFTVEELRPGICHGMFGALAITLGQDRAQTNIGRVRVQVELRSKVRGNNDRVGDKEAF